MRITSAACQTPNKKTPFIPPKLTWPAGRFTMNEDAFAVEHGDFPLACLFWECGRGKSFDVSGKILVKYDPIHLDWISR